LINSPTWLFAGAPILRGCMYLPQPKNSPWSGTKYTFKSKEALAENMPKIENQVSVLAMKGIFSYCLPTVQTNEELQPEMPTNQELTPSSSSAEPEKSNLQANENCQNSFILEGLNILTDLPVVKKHFLESLATSLTSTSSPSFMEFANDELDVCWEKKFALTIDEKDMVTMTIFVENEPKD